MCTDALDVAHATYVHHKLQYGSNLVAYFTECACIGICATACRATCSPPALELWDVCVANMQTFGVLNYRMSIPISGLPSGRIC